MIIDPTIPLNQFHFGTVPQHLQAVIGKIVEKKYQHNVVKCDTYAVRFPGEKKDLWFLEKELT